MQLAAHTTNIETHHGGFVFPLDDLARLGIYIVLLIIN